jgi:NAD(P)-dependent dehydrogenase (short-subunit alcohol dehydrogenase family)
VLGGIEGKVALVTGAARRRGIGRATALRLADEGADVACVDIARPIAGFEGHATASADELDEVVEEIRGRGRRAVALRADVTSWQEVHDAVDRCVAELGRVDLVANVAGGSGVGMGVGPLVAIGEHEFDAVVDLNLKGTWMVSRACAVQMVAQGDGGRIVNVSSQAGKLAWPGLGVYSAAKGAVILLTQAMARELGPTGILVNAVCPGTVDTDLTNPNGMMEQLLDAAPGGLEGWLAQNIPLGRMQSAEEVAAVIAFLCSDDARYVTGEAVNVSGGQTMA